MEKVVVEWNIVFLVCIGNRKDMQKEKVKVKRLVALFYFYRKIVF